MYLCTYVVSRGLPDTTLAQAVFTARSPVRMPGSCFQSWWSTLCSAMELWGEQLCVWYDA